MDSLVRINVGGRVFAVEDHVLHSRGENMITRMLSNTKDYGMQKSYDEKGNLFISGDPEAFAAIVDFLRLGKLHIPPNMSWNKMQAELDYYCIDIQLDDQDSSLCSGLKRDFCLVAEDENFAAKLRERAEKSPELLAQQWMDRNKGDIVEKLADAASKGFMKCQMTLPLSPIPPGCARDENISKSILYHIIPLIRSIGVSVTRLVIADRTQMWMPSIELDASWEDPSASPTGSIEQIVPPHPKRRGGSCNLL